MLSSAREIDPSFASGNHPGDNACVPEDHGHVIGEQPSHEAVSAMQLSMFRVFTVCAGFFFALGASAQLELRVLHSFAGGNDGQQPYAGLVQATDGVLYGTTYLGGSNNVGIVFKVNPDGSGNTPIYNFAANNVNPFGLAYPSGLIQGSDGALYGTSGFGGTSADGSVFRINTDGSGFTVLHSFSHVGGGAYEPTAALVQGSDGTLFGTTEGGGSAGGGTVFKLKTNGTGFVQLHAFGTTPGDAQGPKAPLIQGADGALYGTTYMGGASAVGGASGYGTVYRIYSDGTGEAVLHSFMPSGGDGQRPIGGLAQGNDGTLYGTTQEGGTFSDGGSTGYGTVFKLKPDGTGYSIIHSFDPEAGEGKYPNSGLVIGVDGDLYGTTEFGGSNNVGVVFKLKPDGSECTVLYTFGSHTNDGAYPKAPLVRASDGGLFGTAQFGGAKNFGTIFRLGPAPAIMSSVVRLPDNSIQVTLSAAPHFEYRIEASTDHVHWTVLTNIYNATGVMQFIDPDAATIPNRFYRAAWVP